MKSNNKTQPAHNSVEQHGTSSDSEVRDPHAFSSANVNKSYPEINNCFVELQSHSTTTDDYNSSQSSNLVPGTSNSNHTNDIVVVKAENFKENILMTPDMGRVPYSPDGNVQIENLPLLNEQNSNVTSYYPGGQPVSSSEEKAFSCPICNQKFSRKCSMDAHMATHNDDSSRFLFDSLHDGDGLVVDTYSESSTSGNAISLQKYSCRLCDQQFSKKYWLKEHCSEVHTTDRLFQCDVCSKSFKLLSSLKAHESIHTGEKPFSCNICGKSFRQRGTLDNHLRVHTKEKPFSCDICKKRFSLKANLQTHCRIHTGERPFACELCPKRFRQKVALNRHCLTHVNARRFNCDLCPYKFSTKLHLTRHRVANHPNFAHIPSQLQLQPVAELTATTNPSFVQSQLQVQPVKEATV